MEISRVVFCLDGWESSLRKKMETSYSAIIKKHFCLCADPVTTTCLVTTQSFLVSVPKINRCDWLVFRILGTPHIDHKKGLLVYNICLDERDNPDKLETLDLAVLWWYLKENWTPFEEL